ncbi:MAG: S-layer homology domain-containing protein [Acidaminococcaceae bacterium]
MKKSLVLAMAMALGISATAFAANPFSDVPAGHWAYASVAKLAAAGVVDGYPDGTFKGDNLMTRYEMAQIVAKAYAKGAIKSDDKLMAEFADELDNLGVRVAKLEKKSDNVKIAGAVRARYLDVDKTDKGYTADVRTRLWVKGAINDDWTYTGMLENTQNMNTNAQESETKFRRAYVTGSVGDVGVTAGRYNYTVGQGNVYDDHMDAIQLDFGKVLKASVAYGRAVEGNKNFYDEATEKYTDNTDAYIATLGYKAGIVNLDAAYYAFKDYFVTDDNKIWTVGANAEIAKNLNLGAEYLKSDQETTAGDDDGYVVSMSYKGASASDKGSFGIWTKYYDQAATTYVSHTTDAAHGTLDANGGFKGYAVAANYTFAKNIVGSVEYYDLDSKTGDLTTKTLWSDVTFTF